MKDTKVIRKKRLEGTVISDAMDKTVVVQVISFKKHPKYHKQYKVSYKYKAHDDKNEYHVGDKVIIEGCRPMSKEKRWRVIKKIGNGE